MKATNAATTPKREPATSWFPLDGDPGPLEGLGLGLGVGRPVPMVPLVGAALVEPVPVTRVVAEVLVLVRTVVETEVAAEVVVVVTEAVDEVVETAVLVLPGTLMVIPASRQIPAPAAAAWAA